MSLSEISYPFQLLLKVAKLTEAKKVDGKEFSLFMWPLVLDKLPVEIHQAPSLLLLRKLVKTELFKASFRNRTVNSFKSILDLHC